MDQADQQPRPHAFERFEALAKKLLPVPKKDVFKKDAERPKRKRRIS